MALRTKGFEVGKRLLHFDKHRREFNWIDQFDYEERADEFLTKPASVQLRECTRRTDGATVRYDTSTGEFGILHKEGFIGTYHFKTHRGLEYFMRECQK